MTRFARAKGSKASNERVAEEATPWSQMKQQLLDKNKEIAENKNRQAAINQRNANYKAFLQEKEEEERKRSQWAEFPGEKSEQYSIKRKNKNSPSNISVPDELSDNDETFVTLKAKVDKVLKQSQHSNNDDDSDAPPEEHSSKVQVKAPQLNKKKVKKEKLIIPTDSTSLESNRNIVKLKKQIKNEDNVEAPQPKSEGNKINKKSKKRNSDEEPTTQPKNKKLKKNKLDHNTENNKVAVKINKKEKFKKQKDTKPLKKVVKENLTEEDIKKIEKKKLKRIKQIEKKKKIKAELKKRKEEEKLLSENKETANSSTENENKNVLNNNVNKEESISGETNSLKGKFEKPNKFTNKKFDKGKKFKDDKEHSRRKPFLPTKMFINGKEVEVDYVDGFPVKKEDAIRLKKLRKEMISKGLPRSEINTALKLERRKAEKAFAREKKKVCFNCRKSGHNLSECPELEKGEIAQSGSGICFKCGSTEHTHFECKVVRGQEFKYAQCFICNEQGHIARQCPDNAKGLYPKGGACKVCGDVTHLKKDCPKYQAQQQQLQNSLNIETIGGDNPDLLENNTSNVGLCNRRPNKIVKF